MAYYQSMIIEGKLDGNIVGTAVGIKVDISELTWSGQKKTS